MSKVSEWTMWRRVLLATVLCWLSASSLGLLFAACGSGHFEFRSLLLPGVIPVALFTCTLVALALTPLGVWALRTGKRNLWTFGPAIWLGLAAYDVMLIPRLGREALWAFPVLAAGALIGLGSLPPRDRRESA